MTGTAGAPLSSIDQEPGIRVSFPCLVFTSAGVTLGLDGRTAKGHPRWKLGFGGARPVAGRLRT